LWLEYFSLAIVDEAHRFARIIRFSFKNAAGNYMCLVSIAKCCRLLRVHPVESRVIALYRTSLCVKHL